VQTARRTIRSLLFIAGLIPAGLRPALARAEAAPTTPARAAQTSPIVAVLDVALYTAGANMTEASDADRAVLATAVLRRTLDSLLGSALADSSAVAAQARTALAELGGGKPCNVIVACARAVGTALGVRYVVMAKVSKTSNLIWLLTGQLIDVRSGELLMDDSTELKGDPEAMIKAGVRIFAERVARTVRRREGGT
jgi:uncharacterized protein DUF2380